MQSIIAIREAIESGEMTPREAIAASFDAIAERDNDIGAFETVADRETVLAQAERAHGPLAGIAVGIKDIFDTHDMPTGHGSPIHAGNRPFGDAALVSMLRRAGATIIGKTVTTAYAFLDPAGTRNPHNRDHTPGGSSSGSSSGSGRGTGRTLDFGDSLTRSVKAKSLAGSSSTGAGEKSAPSGPVSRFSRRAEPGRCTSTPPIPIPPRATGSRWRGGPCPRRRPCSGRRR